MKLKMMICVALLATMNCLVMAENSGAKINSKTAAIANSSKSSIQALKFTQQQRYFGHVQLIVASEGLRMDSLGSHFVVVAKPPLWNAVIFRDDDKTIFEEDFVKFADTGMISSFFMSYHEESIPTKDAQKIKVNNLNALRIKTHKKEVFDYLPFDKKFSPKEMQFIHSLYKTPTNGGIPLHYESIAHGHEAISGRSVEGNRLLYLNTSNIQTVEVSPKLFETPKGYKRVKFVGEVAVSSDSRSGAGDFNTFLEQEH